VGGIISVKNSDSILSHIVSFFFLMSVLYISYSSIYTLIWTVTQLNFQENKIACRNLCPLR